MTQYDWRKMQFNISAAQDALEYPGAVSDAFVWQRGPTPTNKLAIEFWDAYSKGTLSDEDSIKARAALKDMIDAATRERERKG